MWPGVGLMIFGAAWLATGSEDMSADEYIIGLVPGIAGGLTLSSMGIGFLISTKKLVQQREQMTRTNLSVLPFMSRDSDFGFMLTGNF